MGLACIPAVWCVAIPGRIRGSVSRMDCGVAVSTAAEQEAERRYQKPVFQTTQSIQYQREQETERQSSVRGFIAGWNECESRHRELLEAAREYREISKNDRFALTGTEALAVSRLLAAAAALDEESGE